MFGVASCTCQRFRGAGVMNGAIVTLEASVVCRFRGKCASLLRVARGAFFFEDSVRFRHSPATVNPRIPGKGALSDPNPREQRKQEAEPEFRALQRRRPLELIEADA